MTEAAAETPDPLPGLSMETLLKRVVAGAVDPTKRKGERHPRWVAVMWVFGLGSTYSQNLCRWAGVDPDKEVKR